MNDVKDNIFKNGHFSIFENDLRLFTPIYLYDDCIRLQADLDHFYQWCSSNGLNVNAEICSQNSFSRRKSKTYFH